MAWNKPSEANQRPEKRDGAKAPSVMRGVIAGLVVVILGALCFFLFSCGDDSSHSALRTPRSALIKEVTPAAAPKAEEPKPEKSKIPFWKVDASQTNGFSEVMQHKWRDAHRPPPAYRSDPSFTRKPARFAIFNYRSENEIAALLTMEPGRGMIGTPNLRGITEDFMKSCEEPIVVTEDDDEYNRNLKKMMTETKIELRQRIADGEKLEDILLNTRKEYQQLAQYKSAINEELQAYLKNPEHTDQDVEDFVNAANQMLEKKGVAPLQLGIIARKRLRNLKETKEGNKTK